MLNLSQSLIEDNLTVSPKWLVRQVSALTSTKSTTKHPANLIDGKKMTFGIASEYKINEPLLLTASHTQLFQGPELAEPFVGAGGNKIANPNLQPEDGTILSLGFGIFKNMAPEQLDQG